MPDLSADTIVGISSANGISARGILKLSGPAAMEVADALLETDGRKPSESPGFSIVYGAVKWRGTEDFPCLSLPAHAYIFRAPKSHTREDVAELHVPGIPWLLEDMVVAACRIGARLAGPGEFTRRAFLNGRISLAHAEAVLGLIRAQSGAEARRMARDIAGDAAAAGRRLKRRVEELLSLVELGLDFSEEDVTPISRSEIIERLASLHREAKELYAELSGSSRQRGAWRIAIAGPTGAGKSRLFNILAGARSKGSEQEYFPGHMRASRILPAIVGGSRHTTRDILSTCLDMGGVAVELVDTAGFGREDEDDLILRLAAERTLSAMRSADILLLAVDRSIPPGAEYRRMLAATSKCKPSAILLLWMKDDLPRHPDWGREDSVPPDLKALKPACEPIRVSAVTGKGIEDLRSHVGAELRKLSERLPFLTDCRSRQTLCAERAMRTIASVLEAVREGISEDAVATDLRECVFCLSEMEGFHITSPQLTESVLDNIFSKFCIGK